MNVLSLQCWYRKKDIIYLLSIGNWSDERKIHQIIKFPVSSGHVHKQHLKAKNKSSFCPNICLHSSPLQQLPLLWFKWRLHWVSMSPMEETFISILHSEYYSSTQFVTDVPIVPTEASRREKWLIDIEAWKTCFERRGIWSKRRIH